MMDRIDPKKDPARRCLPVDEWPGRDRLARQEAFRSGDILDGSGPAAHWRPATRAKVDSSYGRYLTFLHRHGFLDPDAGPAARVTPEILRHYVAELREQVAPVTVAQRVTDLHEALRVMAPGSDIAFIKRAAARLSARARPTRNKHARVVHPQTLLGLAIRMMENAETMTLGRKGWQATRFRDGLIIALLATRAPRLGNLANIRIGTHLTRNDEGYDLVFTGDETKNHAVYERRLHECLTPYVDRYLSVYRPRLLRGAGVDHLWISCLGRPMASISIYDAVREATERAFGHPLNPHLFRDCQATFVALDDPKHVHAIPRLLGHNDPRTAERHYNQAGTVEAARAYQEGIVALRRKLASATRPPGRRKEGGK